MMKSFRIQTQRRSPLLEAQRMNTKVSKTVSLRSLAQALPLTSLIDAFSIIVIYLLIGTQSGGIETPVNSLTLPVAHNMQSLEKAIATLRVENNKLYLNEQPVTLHNLERKLIDLKKLSSDKDIELMVQADQNLQYTVLDPLIKASSLAGIEKLKFAVLPIK